MIFSFDVNRPRLLRRVGLGFLLLTVFGCRQDEPISQRTEPKPEVHEKPNYRLLAAIVPKEANEEKWFFLLVGPEDKINPLENEFSDFLKSVEFSEKPNEPVKWKESANWRKGPMNELRYASYILGEGDKEVLFTVSRAKGSFGDNMKRWREGFLGLPGLSEDELGTVSRDATIGGKKASRIDMSGPGGKLLKSREIK